MSIAFTGRSVVDELKDGSENFGVVCVRIALKDVSRHEADN